MSDELTYWIMHNQSDFSQCIREGIRPSFIQIVDSVLQFERWNERFNHRHLMRRKVRKVYGR
mgnify:CR=1 FL=1